MYSAQAASEMQVSLLPCLGASLKEGASRGLYLIYGREHFACFILCSNEPKCRPIFSLFSLLILVY